MGLFFLIWCMYPILSEKLLHPIDMYREAMSQCWCICLVQKDAIPEWVHLGCELAGIEL